MGDKETDSICEQSTDQFSIVTGYVHFVEDGQPVPGVRVTVLSTSIPVNDDVSDLLVMLFCGSVLELVTDEYGYAECPLIANSVVTVCVHHRGAVQTIRVPDNVESFELTSYPLEQ
jgi:hypothetical protein